jgi:hypothetical protein
MSSAPLRTPSLDHYFKRLGAPYDWNAPNGRDPMQQSFLIFHPISALLVISWPAVLLLVAILVWRIVFIRPLWESSCWGCSRKAPCQGRIWEWFWD